MVASNLFLIIHFENCNKNFLEDYFDQTTNGHLYFNSKKLKTELQILYNRSEFRTMAEAVSLLSFFKIENLSCTFSECVKLLKIIITVPMSRTESEMCFLTLKKIKTFLRNTKDQDRLSSLAML